MLKIGLIGEDPNDKDSIKNLLNQRYKNEVSFYGMLKNVRGYYLDNKKVSNALSIEYKNNLPNHVIFIRDTDGILTEKIKTKKVQDWFEKLNKKVEKKGILLCNIYELEALILADINTFNKIYNTKIKFPGDVTYKKDPKGFLIQKTKKLKKKFAENNCPDLFSKLDINEVIKNCSYFKEFITEFETKTKFYFLTK